MEGESTNRLYCGNLAWEVDDDKLRALFEDCGTVVSAKVGYHPDGRSKGWGIVEFQYPEEAEKGLEKHNTELEGRAVMVRKDQKAPDAAPAGSPAGGDQVNLYVGNLSWGVRWEQLKDAFAAYGAEFAEIKTGRDGRSRGYGIVRVSDAENAKSAIENMNGQMLEGRPMEVREDRVGRRSSGAIGGAGGSGTALFVGNLPWRVSWQQLKDAFAAYGVEHADVKRGFDGRSRGFGIVRVSTPDKAQQAIAEMNGYELEGRPLEVRMDRNM